MTGDTVRAQHLRAARTCTCGWTGPAAQTVHTPRTCSCSLRFLWLTIVLPFKVGGNAVLTPTSGICILESVEPFSVVQRIGSVLCLLVQFLTLIFICNLKSATQLLCAFGLHGSSLEQRCPVPVQAFWPMAGCALGHLPAGPLRSSASLAAQWARAAPFLVTRLL